MRIGLVSGSFLPSVGGMEWKIHYLATEYSAAGHDVTVFTTRPRVSLEPPRLQVEPDYAVVRCGFPLPLIDRLGVSPRLFLRAISKAHRASPLDVLHAHHLGQPTRNALLAKDRLGVPVVATTCGGDIMTHPAIGYGDRLRPRNDRMVRGNLRRADVVGAVSSAIREEIEEMGTSARLVDIPNGVPWETLQVGRSSRLRERLGLGPDAVLLLSVGRLHPVKGYELGVEAFARLAPRFPDAHYVLVGRGIPGLEPLVERLGAADRVHLVEQVPFAEIPYVLASADLFLSPSLMEGFSQVNAQAMAAGLPCVISDAPGNRDYGRDRGVALARSGDVDSMVETLAPLLKSAERRRKLGDEAHEASKRYAWKSIAGEYLRIFESEIR